MKQKSNNNKIQGFNKAVQWRHRAVVILLSIIFYFFNKELALSFFLGSLCFHIYYMMLGFSFWALSFTVPKEKQDSNDEAKSESSKIQPIASFISAIRMALIALALAILILKLNLSLKGIILAFLAYKIVLLVSGFLDQKKSSKNKSK